MSEIILSQPMALPEPATPINIRRATMADLPFIDALQKKYSKELGFFSRAMFEGYIDGGNVLIAETSGQCTVGSGQEHAEGAVSPSLNTAHCPPPTPIGYVISKDRYLKRDELGVIFQLCVEPGYERQFIAANLLRDVFERSSYGCRLYCCWCAQDLPANRFWEAMGFVPIAYRCGGRKKVGGGRCSVGREADSSPSTAHRPLPTAHRIHIFWQKRIRAGDTTTPFWFPAKTEGGAIREDRIILPIPPGMKWTDELPVLLAPSETEGRGVEGPVLSGVEGPVLGGVDPPSTAAIASGGHRAARPTKPMAKRDLKIVLTRATRFAAEPTGQDSPSDERVSQPAGNRRERDESAARTGRAGKRRASAELIGKARELRDRWMDQVGLHGLDAVAGGAVGAGKYDVARRVTGCAEGARRALVGR